MHDNEYSTWYVQHCSPTLSSIISSSRRISLGSNDVANAVGPWVTVYSVWKTSDVQLKADAPTFILAVAGLLLGAGFW
jgi:phosphate/sulfate permease